MITLKELRHNQKNLRAKIIAAAYVLKDQELTAKEAIVSFNKTAEELQTR